MNDDQTAPIQNAEPSPQESPVEAVASFEEPIGPVEIAEAVSDEAESVGEAIRHSTELTMDQARASYERMRQAAEEATANIEAAVAAASSGVAELNLKAFEAVRSSTDAAFEFFQAMTEAKTPADLIALQTEHIRKQVEAINAQSREFAELAGKVSVRAFAPLNETLGKTFGAAA